MKNASPSTRQRGSHMPMMPLPAGKNHVSTSLQPMSGLEQTLMSDLDPDKLSDLAEVLFAFNNYRVGPMPGFYVAVEVEAGKQWCVGQLCADRAKPLKLFDRKRYKTARGAQRAAERMREEELAELAASAG